MTPANVIDTIDWINASDLTMLRARTGTGAERMELVPLACEVLRELVDIFKPSEIDISSYGIREGMLYEQMPDRLRARDPLIEACRAAEAAQSRIPGFGKNLYSFILPIFRHVPPDRLRLVKAACLLHDTTWRTHPDYRAEACFDNATRANLGGLDHPGRVFLGLALLHRYKNSRAGSRMEPLFRLLTEEQMAEAEVLGKAMRFGAMFSINQAEEAGTLEWHPRKRMLELRLTEYGAGLMGEVAEARFGALVQALKAAAKISLAAMV